MRAELADGRILEFPDGTDPSVVQATVQKMLSSATKPQEIGAPSVPRETTPPNWIERQLSKMPTLSPKVESTMRGFAMGAADPSVGIAQLATNIAGQGDAINPAIKAKEQEYQSGRDGSGRQGIDWSRLLGNVAMTAPLGPKSIPNGLAASLRQGAVYGGGVGASMPVTQGEYFPEKGTQMLTSALGGTLTAPASAALARVVSPNATSRISELKAAGVNPTIGQTLGGMANTMEQKATSLPIMGDAIAAARSGARDQFNRATINKAVAPIGETVDDIGQVGIKQAGDKLSAAYDAALSKLGGVKLDQQFNQDLTQLRQMATGLTPNMAKRFENIVNDNLLGKVSPNGSLTAETLKQAESEIGKKAASYGSIGGEQGEMGDALKQVVSLLRQQVSRASPQAAKAVRAADEGYANLVRIEGAGTAAKATEGVFTPGQLLTAVRQGDKSVRDRATARGTALMQDWATQGQKVLGNTYPDSGTAGRVALGAAGIGSGLVNPAIPAALVGGAAMYASPMQKALVAAATQRPAQAKALADAIRRLSPQLAIPAGLAAQPLTQP